MKADLLIALFALACDAVSIELVSVLLPQPEATTAEAAQKAPASTRFLSPKPTESRLQGVLVDQSLPVLRRRHRFVTHHFGADARFARRSWASARGSWDTRIRDSRAC